RGLRRTVLPHTARARFVRLTCRRTNGPPARRWILLPVRAGQCAHSIWGLPCRRGSPCRSLPQTAQENRDSRAFDPGAARFRPGVNRVASSKDRPTLLGVAAWFPYSFFCGPPSHISLAGVWLELSWFRIA